MNSITLKTEELNNICSKILSAVDSNGLSEITETVELVLKDNNFYLQVTNREYFVKVKLSTNISGEFHATIHAELFLKLISKITTELVTLSTTEKTLIIKGNGKYELPLVYEGKEILKLPEININNVTNTFNINGAILNSINTYNSKQFMMGNIVNPIQSFYYMDKNGAITFTTGACVNKFSLEKDVKLLLNSKLVKLFKLFKSDANVDFTIGQDQISQEVIQTKVRFKTSDIEITAILPMNDNAVAKVPVTAIRDRAFKDYDYTAIINKNELLQAINRLFLFSSNSSSIDRTFGIFEFGKDSVTIKDINRINTETIHYSNSVPTLSQYSNVLDFGDLKLVLESSSEDYINLSFGDHQAVVCLRGNIYNIIPEIS